MSTARHSFCCLFLLFFATMLTADLQVLRGDSFDDLIDSLDNDIATTNLIANSVMPDAPRAADKPSLIVALEEFGVLALLQENFFLRTNILRHRSLLDYPEFIPYRHDKDKRGVYVDFFYNQTSRMYFTKGSSNICSYLALSQQSFLQKLENIIDSVKLAFLDLVIDTDKVFRLLGLFQTFTVQERRLGFMIGGKTKFNRWYLNIFAPWYYIERNHFVNEDLQESIDALITDILEETFDIPRLTPEQMVAAEKKKNQFIDQHLIVDKFGIGDTRVYLDYPVIKNKYVSTRAGFLATIPTAFAFKKGLKGTNLQRTINRPILNLTAIANQFTQTQTINPQLFDFGLAALDNLSAMLLETPLGNGGHVGIGVILRNRSPLSSFIKQDWARRIIMRSFISFEYQFPAIEWRSFRIPVNEALFNARDLTDTSPDTSPLIINSNYAFILQQLTDRLFPVAAQALMNPGIIFRWSSQTCYEGNWGGFTIGSDTYVQNKEKFLKIYIDNFTQPMIDSFNARAPIAYQSKLVGSVFWKIEKPDRLYTVSLLGDYTFMNKGIGADFMITLKFDTTF